VQTNVVNIPNRIKDGMRGNRLYLHLESETRDRNGIRNQKYAFRFTGKCDKDTRHGLAWWHNTSLRDDVSGFFSDHIMPNIGMKDDVQFYNQCRINGVLYQSDPCDTTHSGKGDGWHDWCLVHLEGNAFKQAHKENAMHLMGVFCLMGKDILPLTLIWFRSPERETML
jgi:hypothetical protein